MKSIIRILVFLSFTFSFAQEHYKFYIEIPNNTIVPEVSYRRNGTVSLSFPNTNLNDLFSNYTIYKFEKAFPEARTPKLQTVYYIESAEENLKSILTTNYAIYFPHVEEVPEAKFLYTPDDYMNPNDVLYHAKNLDLINVKEAWDYSKGDPDFIIGISDKPIDINHEDLIGKTNTLYTSSTPHSHGTSSASTAAASTDNGKGIAGVGFNSSILGASSSVYQLLQLSNNGARVVNASWYDYCNDDGTFSSSGYDQPLLNEIHENGTVIVVSAGNGVETGYGPASNPCANPDKFFFPASYNHVISVSSVGSQDIGYIYPLTGEARDWRDRVEKIPGSSYYRHQANTSVDIMAPGYGNLAAVPDIGDGVHYFRFGGTSAAAPHVAGGVSLILTANSCLNPNEVESLLKLTSVKLDSISTNVPYIGKIGAGRMDIGKATKAAWQMNPANGGEVLLKNRTFERWDFELLNSPEYIRLKMKDLSKMQM
jgi:subtilisin family serine protease